MNTPGKFYIYYHTDPRTNEVRYIGKGKGRRAWVIGNRRYAHHKNWLNELKGLGLKPVVQIVEYFENEQDAFDKERDLIKSEREKGTKLCNVTDGGDGCSGMKWKDLYSDQEIQYKIEENRKRNLKIKGKTLEELYGSERAFEIKKRLAEFFGSNNPLYGRTLEEIHGPEIASKIKSAVGNSKKGKTLEEMYGFEKAKELIEQWSKRHSGKNNSQYGKTGRNSTCYGRTGDKHPMYGKQQSEETKKKIGLKSNTAKKVTNGYKLWNSVTELGKELGCHSQSLMKRIKEGKPTKGIFYYFDKN